MKFIYLEKSMKMNSIYKNLSAAKKGNVTGMKILFAIAFFALSLFATNSFAQITVSGSNGKDGTTYTTLTGTSTTTGAFAAINSVSEAGMNITITITSNPTEPTSGNVALTGAGGMWTSLTINPSGARTVSAAVAGVFMSLSGAQNVTIDGLNASGNSLNISNTSTSGTATIQFLAGAQNNTIRNCTILGNPSNSTSTGIIYFSSTTSTANSGNTITLCNIGPASESTSNATAIISYGTGGSGLNSSNTISSCNIYDFSGYGMYFTTYTGPSWTISGNSFYRQSTDTYTGYPAYGISQNSSTAYSFSITGNYLAVNLPAAVLPALRGITVQDHLRQ
jgi:hypothetical protein